MNKITTTSAGFTPFITYYHTAVWSLSGPESHSVYQILYTYSSIALSNEMSKNSMLPQLKPYPRLQQIKRAGQ